MLRVTHKQAVAIGRIEANLFDVVLPMGLKVEKVSISGTDLTVTHDPIGAQMPDPGRLEIFVSEKDLARFLNEQSPAGLKNVSVEAKNGMLHVRATKTVLIDVKAYVVCSLRIVDNSKLYVDLESIELMGVGPKHLMQAQIDKINPVIDAKDLPIQATMDRVEIGNGGIILRGRVWPPT